MFSMTNGWPVRTERDRAERRICPPPSPVAPSRTMVMASSFHADDLAKLMHDLDEVLLRRHDLIDRLVGGGRLVDDPRVLAALDVTRRLRVVVHREPPLRLGPGHRPPGAV